jgi:hypothetical protein
MCVNGYIHLGVNSNGESCWLSGIVQDYNKGLQIPFDKVALPCPPRLLSQPSSLSLVSWVSGISLPTWQRYTPTSGGAPKYNAAFIPNLWISWFLDFPSRETGTKWRVFMHIFTSADARWSWQNNFELRLVLTGKIATWTLFTTCKLGNTIFTTWYERSISSVGKIKTLKAVSMYVLYIL